MLSQRRLPCTWLFLLCASSFLHGEALAVCRNTYVRGSITAVICFCSSGSEVLLLLRNSKHNNNTWGLPGGNVEDEDSDLLVTAKREAEEEMGSVPEAAFQNQILTKYAILKLDRMHGTVNAPTKRIQANYV